MENKWQVQECGEESYAITNGKITIATSDADNDQYLQAIADLLNSSGYRFHSENKLELDLHIEAEAAKMELIDVKAKCERYEAALKEAKETINWMWQHMKEPDGQTLLRVDEFNRPANALRIIDEALSAEGEKEERYICPCCKGDGKETCTNPDHGFIDAMGGEIQRLGCPVCGHDPNHKVKNGGKCNTCDGTGKVNMEQFNCFCNETEYGSEPVKIKEDKQ